MIVRVLQISLMLDQFHPVKVERGRGDVLRFCRPNAPVADTLKSKVATNNDPLFFACLRHGVQERPSLRQYSHSLHLKLDQYRLDPMLNATSSDTTGRIIFVLHNLHPPTQK